MKILGDVLLGVGGMGTFIVCASEFTNRVWQIILIVTITVAVFVVVSLIDPDDKSDDGFDFFDRRK